MFILNAAIYLHYSHGLADILINFTNNAEHGSMSFERPHLSAAHLSAATFKRRTFERRDI
jgi:hypothetical protein